MLAAAATTLFLLPGFGLQADDYAPLAAASGAARTVVLDLWPTDVAAIKALGPPGSAPFEAWMDAKAQEARALLRKQPASVVFAHAAGSKVAARLGVPAVLYGAPPLDRCIRLRGGLDPLAAPAPGDVLLPSCGHLSCVPLAAQRKVVGLQVALGLPPLAEDDDEAGIAAVGSVLAELLR